MTRRQAGREAVMTDKPDRHLIRSNEHRAWWGHRPRRLRRRAGLAGTSSMPGRLGFEPLNEIPVIVADLEAMLEAFAARCVLPPVTTSEPLALLAKETARK
jgi:hypothetical protein